MNNLRQACYREKSYSKLYIYDIKSELLLECWSILSLWKQNKLYGIFILYLFFSLLPCYKTGLGTRCKLCFSSILISVIFEQERSRPREEGLNTRTVFTLRQPKNDEILFFKFSCKKDFSFLSNTPPGTARISGLKS